MRKKEISSTGSRSRGQNAYRTDAIVSVKEMVDTLKSEFDEAEADNEK